MQGGAATWAGGAVDDGTNAFLAAALTRVMRATVPIPAVAAASVLHSALLVDLSQGIWGPSRHLRASRELGVF